MILCGQHLLYACAIVYFHGVELRVPTRSAPRQQHRQPGGIRFTPAAAHHGAVRYDSRLRGPHVSDELKSTMTVLLFLIVASIYSIQTDAAVSSEGHIILLLSASTSREPASPNVSILNV
jgi:hypothetical protein